MRQLVITGSGEVVLKDRPSPTLEGKAPGAIIKATHTMIGAGSNIDDVINRRKEPDPKAEDKVISYQVAGVIKEVTPGLKGFKAGDAVCCPGGGFAHSAEEVFIPVHLLAKLSGPELCEAGATVNLACTGLHACRRGRSTLGEWNLVVGLGMVGQFTAQFAKLFGANVIASDISPMRIERARQCGIEHVYNPTEIDLAEKVNELTDGHGADVALIAAKSKDESLFQSVEKMTNNWTGRIVIMGLLPVSRPIGLDSEILMCGGCGWGWRDMHYKRDGNPYPKAYVRWSTDRNIQLFADLLSAGKLTTEPLITHRAPAEKANDAYTQLIEHPDETLGVIIEF